MRSLVAAIAAVLVLSACQDPAGVGLGLIDEEQLNPNVVPVLLTDIGLTADTTIAIGIASSASPEIAQTRVLVGRVADPVFGDARAVAYVDLLQSAALPATATAASVSAAWLVLTRDYVYGDTTTTLPLELRAQQGTWSASTGYPADTLFATGEVLATTTVSAADTLSRFDLPASWVSANAATLVGTEFGTAFEGFAIDVPAGYAAAPGAVYGFSTFATTGSGLRVVVGADTLVYPLSEVFSSLATEPPSLAPPGVLPLRAGSGSAIQFEVDFSDIAASALARARLRIPVEASLGEVGAFVRPFPRQSILYGIRDDAATPRVALAGLTYADGELSVTDTSVLTPLVQRILLTPSTAYDRYEVVPARGTASLDIYPIRLTGGEGEALPRFTLTVVGATD